MRTRNLLLPFVSLLISLSVSACSREAPDAAVATPTPDTPKQANATPIKPLPQKQFGSPITEKTTTALTSIIKEPGKYSGQIVRTEGLVTAVCKSMGCWMEIADDSGNAHIKMAGHSFFVPKDASGHRAVIQGKMVSAAEDSCGQMDGCREHAEKETGQIAKVEIEATGVEFVD